MLTQSTKAHITDLCSAIVPNLRRVAIQSRYISSARQVASLARINRAHVFAAQKQCFCLELLSESRWFLAHYAARNRRLARGLSALFLTAISSRSADLAHKVHWTLCLSQITLWRSLKCVMQFQAQSKRTVLSTLSKLSAPNCLFALRSKRKGRSSRKRIDPHCAMHSRGQAVCP